MSKEFCNGFTPKNCIKSSPITFICFSAAFSLETYSKDLANFAVFNSLLKALITESLASVLKKTVMAISSLKLSDNRLELITKRPKIPNKNNTKKILNTTEK